MNRFIEKVLCALHKVPVIKHKLASLSADYRAIHENFDYNHETNGERWLIETLARQNCLSVCFDVGANQGDWTDLILAANPSATVHCFEVSPPTFCKLAGRFSKDQRVILNPVGLSNQAGDIELQHCVDSDVLSSMVGVVCSRNTSTIAAKVVRGVDYCSQQSISKIDLLKIDVEGAESLVLDGFDDFLTPAAVPLIQFEYGLVCIITKFLLRDFHEYFESRGYRVGKLFPHYVRFRDYRFQDEDFLGPNYLAASPEMAALLSEN